MREYSWKAESCRLEVACELSKSKWVLRFASDVSPKAVGVRLEVSSLDWRLSEEIARAKRRLGLAPQAPVYALYEAGRDGFWPARFLERLGVKVLVVAASSLEVSRQARRRKTDSLDVQALGRALKRYLEGERGAMQVSELISEEQEAAREPGRERAQLVAERTRLKNQITSRLARFGVTLALGSDLPRQVDVAKTAYGTDLPTEVKAAVKRSWLLVGQVEELIAQIEKEQAERVARCEGRNEEKIGALWELRGFGPTHSTGLTHELYWRSFRRAREVSAATGLIGTPFQSGEMNREQGITRASCSRVRAMLIEAGWCWVRYQPDSELTQWFNRRFAKRGKIARRIGIVALSRKLAVALWKYLEYGEVPEGAVFKDEAP